MTDDIQGANLRVSPLIQRIGGCDSIAFVVGDRNDNPLGFKTFDKTVKANPNVARRKILCKSRQPQSKKQEQIGAVPEAGTVRLRLA